jgi:hypothetical protein
VAADAEFLDDGAKWQEGEFGLFGGRHGAGGVCTGCPGGSCYKGDFY